LKVLVFSISNPIGFKESGQRYHERVSESCWKLDVEMHEIVDSNRFQNPFQRLLVDFWDLGRITQLVSGKTSRIGQRFLE
jgi:hypothetical protein